MGSPYADLDRPPLRVGPLRQALVRPESLWRSVEILDETPSTNVVVAARADHGEPEGLVVVAEQQTAGRGRLGRVWASPPRAGLTFSVLLRPGAVVGGSTSWLPLLTGLALAEALDAVADLPTDRAVRLKWPNDLLIEEGKVGGILVERRPEGGAIVVGVGLNVSTRAAELPTPTSTSLALAGGVTDRETLLRASLRRLADRYREWLALEGDVTELRSAYEQRCSTIGSDVEVLLPGGTTVTGAAKGVDENGCLVLATADGEAVVGSGDVVHLRPKA